MKKLFVSLFLLISLASFAKAEDFGPMNEKTSKLIKMVNKAHKNDWKTLNLAARLSINWNADLELAKEWLDASIFINENAEAYEIIGDYYLRKGDSKEAYNHYHKALEIGMFTLPKKDFDRVQRKALCFGKSLQ